jgi:REP element-mobilizing transposase RayT
MQPRHVRPGVTYLLTRRCLERRFLLRPSRLTNQIVEYCLAVAADRSGMELHVFCAMSNHVHAVVTDVEGRLPDFLHHFHRNVAVALNASLGRTENVWAVGQTSAVELGDQWDVLEKMAYVVANPTAAGLVRSPQKWPGVITARLCESKTVRRPKGFFRTNGNMPVSARLHYTVPAQLRYLGERKVVELFFRAVSEKVRAARAKAEAERRPFLGPKAVLATAISKSAATEERLKGRNPRFAIRDGKLRRAAILRWRAFLLAYRDAFFRWRDGQREVRFPEGTWMMARVHRATCGPPLCA